MPPPCLFGGDVLKLRCGWRGVRMPATLLHRRSPLFFMLAPSARVQRAAAAVQAEQASLCSGLLCRLLRPLGAVVPVLADCLQLATLRLGGQSVYEQERE